MATPISAISTPGSTSLAASPGSEGISKRIETFPFQVFPFSGVYDPKFEQGLGFLRVEFRPEGRFAYRFSYNLPSGESYGYTGFTFWFFDLNDPNNLSSQDLTPFHSIQVTVEFESNFHQAEIFIKDIAYVEGVESRHANYLTLKNEAPPNGKLEVNGGQFKFTIPLSSFDQVNFKAVREVGFLVDTDAPQDEGWLVVHEVLFVP
jgi:hypothetical protein